MSAYNEKIYMDWVTENYPNWLIVIGDYGLNLKRSYNFFTEDRDRFNEYLEFSKKYFEPIINNCPFCKDKKECDCPF